MRKIKNYLFAVNKKIDLYLNNRFTLAIVSLFISISILLVSSYIRTGSLTLFDSRNITIINDVTVNAYYDHEKLEVKGIPKTVNVSAVGSEQIISTIKRTKDFEVFADLSNLELGEHIIPLYVRNYDHSITLNVEPKYIKVNVYNKVEVEKNISYELINEDKIDKRYNIKQVSLERDKVLIKGDEETLNSISYVKAIVDLSTLDINKHTYANIYAYDSFGQKLNVSIEPTKVSATVDLEVSKKTVKIGLKAIGKTKDGKVIQSFTSNISETTIYGPADVLATITEIDAPINLNDINSDISRKVKLELPAGVKFSEVKEIDVNIKLGIASKREFKVPLTKINLKKGYQATLINGSSNEATIELTGSKELLDTLTNEDIKAYINLNSLNVGKNTVKIGIIVPGIIQYKLLSNEKVDVNIVSTNE